MTSSDDELREIPSRVEQDEYIINSKHEERRSRALSFGTRLIHAVIGLLIGFAWWIPFVLLGSVISKILGVYLKNIGMRADEYASVIFCILPAPIGSLLGGIIGGHIGNKINHKYLQTVIRLK